MVLVHDTRADHYRWEDESSGETVANYGSLQMAEIWFGSWLTMESRIERPLLIGG